MRSRLALLWTAVIAVVVAGFITAPANAAGSEPCDIYDAAGTPCVAAHSTTRALYGNYYGPLYQVTRTSDGLMKDIWTLSPGGVANAAAQDSFCPANSCVITKIYDQSSNHNDLTVEGSGQNGGPDVGAPADALPVSVEGHTAYGVMISAGMGYRDNSAVKTSEHGEAEGMYMVASGNHVNGNCCFDYGNTERTNNDTGDGHMDAVNLSTRCGWFGGCTQPGPWVQADLENGLFQSSGGANQANTGTGPIPYVTAILENGGKDAAGGFTLKQGNAQSGGLTTTYSGPEPTVVQNNGGPYSPMSQEGGIVLGTGGDDSNGSIGSFFEGVMTSGVPGDGADNAVQANIVAAGYGGANGVPGAELANGSAISLRATSPCCTAKYIRHYQGKAILSPITSSSSELDRHDATWIVRPGLAYGPCVSLESRNYPGQYLRHYNGEIYKQPDDGSTQFALDATFCPTAGNSGSYTSFESYNYAGYYLRHYQGTVYIANDGGTTHPWDTATLWADDTTFQVDGPWAP